MALFTIYDVRVRPGRLDDFYAKEVGGHAMAVRLGAEVYNGGAKLPENSSEVLSVRVVEDFAP